MALINYQLARFEASYGTVEQLPEPTTPEVAVAGRSNVGKSSLLNKVFGRKNLVKVSATPGKTANINFFEVDGIRFVDLPGYGYAKVSMKERERWANLISGYFDQERHRHSAGRCFAPRTAGVRVCRPPLCGADVHPGKPAAGLHAPANGAGTASGCRARRTAPPREPGRGVCRLAAAGGAALYHPAGGAGRTGTHPGAQGAGAGVRHAHGVLPARHPCGGQRRGNHPGGHRPDAALRH